MLRERAFRFEFEISRRHIKKFLRNHRKTVVAASVALIVIVSWRYLVGFASTADFYPSSCLGSWDNVQNALGKPDVNPGSPGSSFTALNSALFSTGTAQMFCGNFSGETNISELQAKSFQSAELVLSWNVVFPDQPGASVSSTDANASDTGSMVPTAAGPTSSSAADGSPILDATTTQVQPPTPPPATDSGAGSVTPDTSQQDAAPTPAPAPDMTSPDTGPSSWLFRWLPTALADDSSSPQAALSVASSVVEDIPSTSTPPVPIVVNTSMFQNIVLPASAPGDFVGIVYSTDGVTWQPLTDINADNWQIARYAIPITSWDQLQHLQVALVGLGAADAPKVYLDAMAVEVSYEDAPEATTDITPKPDAQDQNQNQDQATSTSADQQTIAPDEIIQKSTQPEGDVFDQGARQQCVVAPFSQTIAPGGAARFALQLFSGLTTPSSTPKKGIPTSTLPYGYQHPVYQTRLGSLPVGVSSYIQGDVGASDDASTTQHIQVDVGRNAVSGSYSALVVYRERQDDASLRSTGCQLNVVIQ